jgi:general secretion pathway protein M
MNFYTLAKPVRQLLALALLGLSIAAVYFFTVVPVRTKVADLADRIEQERLTLGRLSAIGNDETAARELDNATTTARAKGLFLEGESESIRMANLQSLLADIVAANGIKPRSIRNLPARERNDVRMLGVQLQLVATIDGLRKILIAIEEQRRVLIVEALQVSPLTGTWVGNDELRGTLDIRFDVFGVESRQK